MGKLIMSKKERDQLKIFENLANGEIKQSVAAQMLNISVRWVREKLKRYKKHGDSGLVHLSRGKPSLKKWCKEEQDITTKLLETEWKGFGPTFVAEKLNELKGIKTNKETVRQMMIAKSFWISGK